MDGMEKLKEHEMLAFSNNYINCLNEFLGYDVKLRFDDSFMLVYENIDYEINNLIAVTNSQISTILDKTFKNFHEEFGSVLYRTSLNDIFLSELIVNMVREYDSSPNDIVNFISHLKKLSNRTYEMDTNEIGFIVVKKDNVDIFEYLDSVKIDFIPFSRIMVYEEIFNNKKTLKLIDSKSLALVLNHKYEIVGLAKKRTKQSSISDIMIGRCNTLQDNRLSSVIYEYTTRLIVYADHYENIGDYIAKREEITRLLNHQEKIRSILVNKYKIDKNQRDPEYLQIVFKDYSKNELKELVQLLEESQKYTSGLMKLIDETELYLERESVILEEVQTNAFKKAYYKKIYDKLKQNNITKHDGIDFVYIKNKKINWSSYSNFDFLLTYDNGIWKQKNHMLLYITISQYIMRVFLEEDNTYLQSIKQDSVELDEYIGNKIDEWSHRILTFFNRLKNLSDNNIGALFVIIKNKKGNLETVFENLLSKTSFADKTYAPIIKTNSNENINIVDCDPYLFDLISSVDGAVLLDTNLNILSFGDMISNDSKEIEVRGKSYQGARTNAALAASKYGLAIKVSEDGDITIFNDRQEIIQA